MAKAIDRHLKKLPLGAIKAQGWIGDQLAYVNELQKHIGAMPGLVKNGEWDGEEELPRYVRGLILLSSCLDDKALRDKVSKFVLPIINSASEGGAFGPSGVRSQSPQIEGLKALLSYYELTGDKNIITFLKKHFKNQFNTYEISASWFNARARLLEEIPAIEAVYRETDVEWLQDLGEKLRESSNDWIKIAKKFPYKKPYFKYVSQRAIKRTMRTVNAYARTDSRRKKEPSIDFFDAQWRKSAHQTMVETNGVNIAKAVKYPAVYGRFMGDDELRKLSLKMVSYLEKYHGTPTGMFACEPRIYGKKSAQASVDIEATVEMIESLVEVIKETGDFHCVDILERIVFNVIGASCFEDCSAVQDMLVVNQVEASSICKPEFGEESNAYFSKKLSRGAIAVLSAYPLYLQTACMTKDAEIDFLTYAPCKMDISIGGCKLTVSEQTGYPFRNTVVFKVEKADGEPEVKIRFRVPRNAQMQLISGGEVVATGTKEISVKCILRAGSTFMLKMNIPLSVEDNGDGTVSMFKSNVLMTLKMPTDVRACADDKGVLNASATRKWNVAPIIAKHTQSGIRKIGEEERTIVHDITQTPLSFATPPFELGILSKNVYKWECDEFGFAPIPKKPTFSEESLERIYIPYGCSLLHIAKYPKCVKK